MIGLRRAPCRRTCRPSCWCDGNPLAVRGFNVVGLRRRDFQRRAHRRRQADAQGCCTARAARWSDARAAIEALAQPTPEAGRRRRHDDAASWRGATARHRPLSPMEAHPASRWSRARRPATCWPACCWTACARAGPSSRRSGIGGPQMASRGFEAWWPHEKLAVRGYVEVLRHYREIVGIRNQLRERLLARAARRLHRRRRARLQPGPGSGAEGARHQDRALRLPLDLGLAPGARGEDQAQLPTTCCASFPSSRSCWRGTASRPPTSGHPLANVIPMEPDQAAARRALGLPRGRRGARHPAGQPRLRGRAPGRRASSRPRRCCSEARPAHPIRRAGRARACAARSRRRPARPGSRDGLHDRRRPVARRAGRLRPGAGRQRHGHAGGGAVQAADGDRLQHELADLPDHAAASSCSPGSACPTSCAANSSCPNCCRTRPIPSRSLRRSWNGCEAPARMAAVQEKFTALHAQLQRDTATLATDAIEKVLASAEAGARLHWDPIRA